MNQCDGCRRKLPLVHGTHYGEGYDMIGCTAGRYEPKYIFGMDAFRDNEHERKALAEAIERIEGGDEVEDLTVGELERLVAASRAKGSNRAAIEFGFKAQDYLDNEAERIGTKKLEDDFNDYWGDKGSHREQQFIQDLKDAGRYRG